MKTRRIWRPAVALLCVGALLLAACSSDDDDGAAPEDTAVEESEMDPDGVVKVAYDLNQSDVAWDFNPLRLVGGNSNSNDMLWYLVYARLMRPMPDGSIEPELATSVEVVDPNTIEVELRDGLEFSDGTPLDAEAVKASYEALLAARPDNETGFLEAFYSLDSIEVTGPTSLTLGFSDGTAPSWYDAHIPTWASLVIKPDDVDPLMPVGAGPYTVTAHEQGVSMTLEKNPTYWNADEVNFAGIEFTSIAFSQANSALAAVQTDQVDITFSEPALIASVSEPLEVVTKVGPNTAAMMHICKSEPPLDDPRVRLALNKGLDREAISEAVYAGTAVPATEPWPEGHRLYNPDVGDVAAYDPEGARQLLEEAGYGDGVTIDMYPIQAFNLDETAEVMKSQLAEIGMTVNIVPTTDYVTDFLENPTPGVGVYPNSQGGRVKVGAWTGDSLGNVCDYDDPEMNQLVDSLTGVSEQSDEAQEIWWQIDEIVTTEALSGFIVYRSDIGIYDTERIGDMELWPLGSWLVPDPFVSYIKAGS